MKLLVLSGNVKHDGLCHQIEQQVLLGAKAAGAEVSLILPKGLKPCQVCGTGWGICKTERRCVFGEDGFNQIHQAVKEADAYCLISPVYWSEVAEGLKCVLDRLRRCEYGTFGRAGEGAMYGKQVLLIASAGGSGNGVLPCLEQLDRFSRHMGASIYDTIAINRWNSLYKKDAVFQAAEAVSLGKVVQKH